ncbi:MAG: pyridoxal phosphate-dependent decarboxylase family protein, partial [Cyclobacteriaceae bacterium]
MLELNKQNRKKLWSELTGLIEDYISTVHNLNVTPNFTKARLTNVIESLDLSNGTDPFEALSWVFKQLTEYQVHTPHPGYYGLFNPASSTMGIAADALVAAFNPQLAAWSHSPFANELERKLVMDFGQRFGYRSNRIDGTFTSGGAEANHTALLTALVHHFPDYKTHGLRSVKGSPVFYVSAESHHSLIKAAAMCGLGTEAVRLVPVDKNLSMDASLLPGLIEEDRKKGNQPFMVVATGGTTNAGAIDPINEIGIVAKNEELWFHVDAAWGGAVVLTHKYKEVLAGIENADSITFDAHKWLSVPMGAGMYVTQHPD